jgi:serine protease Do
MITPQIATQLNRVAEQLKASTVEISNSGDSSGSGTIWRSHGLIVTNAHVIQDWQTKVILADRRVLKAKVIAIDPQRDLAALKIDATNLSAIKVGDAKKLRVGELVLAVGNPHGIAGAVTMGMLHSLDLSETEKIKETRRYPKRLFIPYLQSQKWIVADIRLAPGNSGGLLADARGEVLGINTAIAGGLALAIPSQEIESFLDGRT